MPTRCVGAPVSFKIVGQHMVTRNTILYVRYTISYTHIRYCTSEFYIFSKKKVLTSIKVPNLQRVTAPKVLGSNLAFSTTHMPCLFSASWRFEWSKKTYIVEKIRFKPIHWSGVCCQLLYSPQYYVYSTYNSSKYVHYIICWRTKLYV